MNLTTTLTLYGTRWTSQESGWLKRATDKEDPHGEDKVSQEGNRCVCVWEAYQSPPLFRPILSILVPFLPIPQKEKALTPLHLAAEHGQKTVVQRLAAGGAKVEANGSVSQSAGRDEVVGMSVKTEG